MTDFLTPILIALVSGLLPAIIWLKFWLQEDEKHPEPNNLLIKTFLYGMAVVPIAIAFQFFISKYFLNNYEIADMFKVSYPLALITLILWSTIEEFLKFAGAYWGGLSKKANDEPIDAVVYMIASALGFASLENALYLFSPILENQTTAALLTGNLRFIGATLLHVACSATVGVFLSFVFYKKTIIKKKHLFWGLVTAISLHTLFNSFIIRAEKFTLIGFMMVWFVIILIIILLEKIKKIYFRS